MGGLRSMSKFAAILFVFATLAACTQVDKAAAIKLADAGKVAATNGAAEAAAARADFVAGGERSAALQLLGRAAAPVYIRQAEFDPPDQAANKRRLKIAAVLKQREASLAALAATYGEMAALAGADPGANVRKAAADLVDKTNGLATAVNALALPGLPVIPLIAKTAGAAFGEVAALYAEERQRQEILATNGIVRDALNVLRESLKRERIYVAAIRQEVAVARENLANAALNQGLVDQSVAVARIAELAGFAPVKDAAAAVAGARIDGDGEQMRRQRLVWALAGFEKFRATAKADAIADANAALEKALEKLDAGHVSLAERQPFGADEALALAMAIKEAVERIRAAEEGQ
jgi:hypothetical protein